MEKAEASFTEQEQSLDHDDSDYEYDVPDKIVGPARNFYAAKDRLTDFIEKTLIEDLKENFGYVSGPQGQAVGQARQIARSN